MDHREGSWNTEEQASIRKQLDRIVSSDQFVHGARQVRFLTFIVESTLRREADRLNQFAVGVEVFDRDEEFDPSIDSIVRVEAGRLRSKLTEYYAGPGAHDAVVISLPKGGYGVAVEFRDTAATSATESQPATTGWQNVVIIALLAAMLAGSIYSGFFRVPGSDSAASAGVDRGTQPAIAILPFENMSSYPAQDYFSDGITEDIITDLSILSDLTVIARHSTFVYKNQSVSISEVARDLDVQYVLEGSVRKDANRLRITAQLIDVSTEGHIWAERFDRDIHDVFAVQDDVTRRIVEALELNLDRAERERLGRRGTTNVEAHDLLLRGQEQFYKFSPHGVEEAVSLFEEAQLADSLYAEAYAWQSRALVYARISGINNSHAETIAPAIVLAERALDLNDLLPEAHANYGWALHWNDQSLTGIDALSRAIELDPNYANAYLWQSMILSSIRRGQDSMDAIRKSLRLDPNYSVTHIFALGRAHLALGDYDEAIAQFERGIARNPNFVPNHVFKLFVLESRGQNEAAAAAMKALVEANPNYAQSAAYLTYLDERAALGMSP